MSQNRAARACLLVVAFALPAAAAPSSVDESGEPERPEVEVHGVVDLRLASAGRPISWLDGGFGRYRYGGRDGDRDGVGDHSSTEFHAGQLSLVVDARLGDTWKAHVQLNVDADSDRYETLEPVGLIEGFASWNPVLSDTIRLRTRAGVFIPPYSLEHPEIAWSTRYTITPSAIGSWLGEELKSTGVEATLVLQLGSQSELQLQGSAFSGNDSTGALLAWRGWALHDRQGMLGDELPLPSILSLTDSRFFPNQGLRTQPFREIDGRLGVNGQARLRLGPHVLAQGGYYDNLGNQQATKDHDYAWHTRFALGGVQLDFGPLTLLGQFMDGRTEMGLVFPVLVDAPFRAGFGMASFAAGSSTRLTARYDRWEVRDEDTWLEGKDLNDDDGWAVTGAVLQSFGAHHRLALEYIHTSVDHPFAITTGELAEFDQDQFQASYRLSF